MKGHPIGVLALVVEPGPDFNKQCTVATEAQQIHCSGCNQDHLLQGVQMVNGGRDVFEVKHLIPMLDPDPPLETVAEQEEELAR